MDVGDWATWIGSAAAIVAAAASIAVWMRERTNVVWEVRIPEHGRSAIANVGSATAKDVRVEVGSTGENGAVHYTETAPTLAPNEVIRMVIVPSYGVAGYAVVVTWRGPFGKHNTWTYQVI